MFSGLAPSFNKEFKHCTRAPATYVVAAMQLIGLLLFGYAVDTDIPSVPMVVLDFINDSESRQLVKEFENARYFTVVGEVRSDQELHDAIVAGRAQAGIKIPSDYSSNLRSARQGQVQVIIDGSDARTALQILNSSQQLGFLKSLEREGISPAMFSVDVRPHLLFNPNLRSANFFVPGLIAVLLQLWALCLVPLAIRHDCEGGQPMPGAQAGFIFGKLLFNLFVGLVLTGLLLVVMVYVFGVSIDGSIPLLLALSVVFLSAELGAGLVVSAWTEQPSLTALLSLLFLLSSMMLSGFVFPRESMPPMISAIGLFMPVTHSLEILRGIILRGAGIAVLWKPALVLAGLSAVFCGAGLLALKKRWD
jgi:ABC-type multidrug transport system permease subunit